MIAGAARALLTAALLMTTVEPGPAPRPSTREAVRAPEARTGPYRVLVERVIQNLQLNTELSRAGVAAPRPRGNRSSVQVTLRVVADTPQAAAALDLLTIHSVSLLSDGRRLEVPHHGSALEDVAGAAVRAYVGAAEIGPRATEIWSIDGEISAYERAEPVTAEIALATIPAAILAGEAAIRVQSCSVQDGSVRLLLLVSTPETAQIAPASPDGAYGIQLVDDTGGVSPPTGCSVQPRAGGELEFHLHYHGLRGAPARLRVEFMLRRGARRVYPFQVRRIPLPAAIKDEG